MSESYESCLACWQRSGLKCTCHAGIYARSILDLLGQVSFVWDAQIDAMIEKEFGAMPHDNGLTYEADSPCDKDAASLDSTNHIHYRCCDIHEAPRARDGFFATRLGESTQGRGALPISPCQMLDSPSDTFGKAL